MLLKSYVLIMFGGALGTGLRMWVSAFLATHFGEHFPVGTLVVNITGSFLISLVAGLAGPDGRWAAPMIVRNFLMVGIMGGYTTFSAFSLQTLNLMNTAQWGRAGAYVVLSVALCLAAVWLGQVAANALNAR